MKNDINDIKELLQEEKQQEKSDKELYNNLVKYLYNIFDSELEKDLLERGFIYFSYNDTRKNVCNELAGNQKEYNYYFMNYDKALKQVKSFFAEDLKRARKEQEEREKQEQEAGKEKKDKKSPLFFGIDLFLAIVLIPIILFFDVLEKTK